MVKVPGDGIEGDNDTEVELDDNDPAFVQGSIRPISKVVHLNFYKHLIILIHRSWCRRI